MTLLFIRTDHDTATHYLYKLTEPLIPEAESRGYRVDRVEGEDKNFKNIDKRIRNGKYQFIFFNGHGTDSAFHDNKRREFINMGSVNLLKGTVTFARACDSLKKLALEAVKHGCDAFIGYKNKLWVARYHNTECNPEKDPIATKIINCSNTVVRELLKQKTVEEAISESHKHSIREITEMIYSKEPLFSPTLAALLMNDESLGYHGNPNARLNSTPT
ncbi:MAG: hypothetical protein V1744_08135 [Candidatus Altiarchaeota archaeon]